MDLPKVVLCPASSPAAFAHFGKSVQNPVAITQSEVTPEFVGRGGLRVWAARAARQWEKARKGDVLLFFRASAAFAQAECLGTTISSQLAASVWGEPEWQYLFFLGPVKPMSVPLADINKALGYKSQYQVRQLVVLNETQSRAVLQLIRTH